MVAYILNTIVLIGCTFWLWNQLITKSKQLILHVFFGFIGLTFLAFFISVGLNNEYLIFVDYLFPGLWSIGIFWLISLGLILAKNHSDKARKSLFEDIAQTIVLVLVPALVWFWLRNADFRIGG